MSRARVAIVIPCYDLGRTLEETVASAERQTHPPAEVVVVDDGSRDPYTRQVLARLARAGTKVISTENRGPAAARNLGVSATRSPFIMLLDADDLVEPTYIEKAAAALMQRPELGFVSCALQAFGGASYEWTPPPCTVADTIARGGVHVSTMFRREVWERAGGFDPSLPAYEDTDFWLTALELGFEGEILDEPLLLYRVRHGSRYHLGIGRETYLDSKAAILAKHPDSVASFGADILASLIDLQKEVRGHAASLVARRSVLEGDIEDLRADVADVAGALERRREAAFDWGGIQRWISAATRPANGKRRTVGEHYVRSFVEANAEAGDRSTVTIREGDQWPSLAEGRAKTLLVIDAIGALVDPRAAVESCRKWLAPDGLFLATFSSLPTGSAHARWGFTEASVRALLTEVFPADRIEVTTYGNLRAAVASVAGVPADLVPPEDLDRRDPSHPVVIGARVELAPRGSRLKGTRSRGRRLEPTPQARPVRFEQGVALVYHRVAELEPDVHGLCVAPDAFRAQMELLRASYTAVSLPDLVEGARERSLPSRAVAVTFDDGYLDNLEVASPILTELGIPATFFVNTEQLADKREAWWDTVERVLLAEADGEPPARLRLGVGEQTVNLSTATPGERRQAVFAIHGVALRMGADQRAELLSQLLAWSSMTLEPRATHRLVTGDEVVVLAGRPGHAIGAHTVHHLMLPSHSFEVQWREIAESQEALEQLTGRSVDALSYPYGACALSTTEIADHTGFASAWTVEAGTVTPHSDPFRLPRLEVKHGDAGSFNTRLERCFAAS